MPWWLTAAVVARDVLIGLGALIFYRLWFGPLHGRPTLISKINTGAQLLYLMLVLLQQPPCGLPPREVLDALRARSPVATTVLSGRALRRDLHAARLDARRAACRAATCASSRWAVRLPDRAVFASFLPGAQRRGASRTLQRVAARRKRPASPGCAAPAGAGKTHLLQAICAAAGDARARAATCRSRELAAARCRRARGPAADAVPVPG